MIFWREKLGIKLISEIELTRVERVARDLQGKVKAGKTIQLHLESLKALVLWSVGRGYLEKDPLERLVAFNTTTKDRRRALTEVELAALLNAAPVDRRLIYETAVCTGYRKGELTALTVADVDVKNCTLPLAAEFCKGRRDARQPIPASLAAKWAAVSKGKEPKAKLLDVDFHIDRLFHRDREQADIEPKTTDGKALL